nr:IS66 family insertion sequence element accessory protein TnpB [Rhizobium lusitanum]
MKRCCGSCGVWRRCGDHASFRSKCAGVDCNGPYRHAVWVSIACIAGAGGAETEPSGRQSFVFRSRSGSLIKVIWSDGQGSCLFTKKLDRGRFVWPSAEGGAIAISAAQLSYLLSGIDWCHPQETFRPMKVG